MSVIGLIIGLLFCALFAVALIWATQERQPLLDDADDDFDLREKPKLRLNERGTPFDSGIRDLIRDGRSRDAVRIYQEFTGSTLEDAEREITRLEWEETSDTALPPQQHHSS